MKSPSDPAADRAATSRNTVLAWDRTNPFVIDVTVTPENVDGYGHVSTHNYVQWMIDCAFDHSTAVGLPESRCKDMARGMAAVRFDVDLQGSAYAEDRLKVATWIINPDGKLRLSRQFQIINVDTGKTLARAVFDFVCTNLDTGRPARLPAVFVEGYCVESEAV